MNGPWQNNYSELPLVNNVRSQTAVTENVQPATTNWVEPKESPTTPVPTTPRENEEMEQRRQETVLPPIFPPPFQDQNHPPTFNDGDLFSDDGIDFIDRLLFEDGEYL